MKNAQIIEELKTGKIIRFIPEGERKTPGNDILIIKDTPELSLKGAIRIYQKQFDKLESMESIRLAAVYYNLHPNHPETRIYRINPIKNN